MPNDYFVPGYDEIGGIGRRPKPMLSPAEYFQQRRVQMQPMPPMMGQPDLQGGIGGPAVPPVMEVEQPAPPPMKPLSRAERYQQEVGATAPKPMSALSRTLTGLNKGGVIGAVGSLLDRQAPQREAYNQSRQTFMDKAGLEHQDKQDELSELQKHAYQANIDSQIDARKQAGQDRDEDRERQYLAQGWMETAPGEMQEMPEDGKPGRYEYANVGGKQRRRMTDYAKKSDAKAAEMETWREIPPAVAQALGYPAGTKVPANELDNYSKMVADAAQKTADREQRAILQRESIETRKTLGMMMAGIAQQNANTAKQNADTRTSGAGKSKLTPQQRSFLSESAAVDKAIDELLTQYDQTGDIEGIGPVAGRAGSLLSRTTGYGTDKARANRAALGNISGQILHEKYGSALSKGENDRAAAFIASITNHPADAASKLRQLKAFNGLKRQELIEAEGDHPQPAAPKAEQQPQVVQMYNPKTGKTGPVRADRVADAEKAGLTRAR